MHLTSKETQQIAASAAKLTNNEIIEKTQLSAIRVVPENGNAAFFQKLV